MSYIVIFRPHGELNLHTQYVGPFSTHDEAMDALSAMPALGIAPANAEPGVKCIAQLDSALRLHKLAGLNGYTVRAQWSAADDAVEFVAQDGDGFRVGGPYHLSSTAWELCGDAYMASTMLPKSEGPREGVELYNVAGAKRLGFWPFDIDGETAAYAAAERAKADFLKHSPGAVLTINRTAQEA